MENGKWKTQTEAEVKCGVWIEVLATDNRQPTTDNRVKLLVATGNRGKLAELNDLLADVPIELFSLGDVGGFEEVEETGATFAENAALKASGYALLAGIVTLADDSGLEVEALDNRPGVLSARYGGAQLGFDEKMIMLLGELEKTGGKNRAARFVCAMAVADATGKIVHSAEGICNGRIAKKPRGTGGFGYDPIFIPDGFENTFGELSNDVKQQISHRFRAFLRNNPVFTAFLRDLT